MKGEVGEVKVLLWPFVGDPISIVLYLTELHPLFWRMVLANVMSCEAFRDEKSTNGY